MANSKVAVIKIENDGTVWVRPVQTLCISCESAGTCTKRGTSFKAVNPSNFTVKVGDTVALASSPKAAFAQGVYALLFPVACAVAGYAVSPAIAGLAGVAAGEELRALSVLACMFVAAGIVLATRKFAKKVVKPEITGVEEKVE